jgi:rubredoxin
MSSQTPPPEPLDRYECRACGYVYEPEKGDSRKVPPGTAFSDLPAKWACPVCSAPVSKFDNIGPVGSPSGFKENLSYGIGVNALPPGQKNLLIFGVLGLFILILLSFYGLG